MWTNMAVEGENGEIWVLLVQEVLIYKLYSPFYKLGREENFIWLTTNRILYVNMFVIL